MSNQISEEAKKLIDKYKKATDLERTYNETNGDKIKLHQVSSKIAFLYEKVRNTVDYREEHLLRKDAIKRILKRRLMTEKNEFDVSKFLVYELIRARYLPNNHIPEERIEEVKLIVEKYTLLINKIPEETESEKNNSDFLFDWIIGVAACEIEGNIAPYNKEDAMIEFACEIIDKKLNVPRKVMSEEDEKIQICIAVLRNMAKYDMDIIRYKLFVIKHPGWFMAPSEELIIKMAQNIDSAISETDKQIYHPMGESFSRFVKKNLAYFTIFQDAALVNLKNIEKLFVHHYHIEDAIKETCVKKYKEAKVKLRRAAIRSIIYIFITKIMLALIIELPFDKYVLGHINYLALGINILFPPLLMFLVVITIRVPSKKNTDLIVSGIKEMIYGKYNTPPFIIKGLLSRGSIFYKTFKIFYLIIFALSFGMIIWVLLKLSFNFVSIGLFLFFLSVVSYFGIRIRQNAREMVVTQRKEGIITFITDLFSIPILQMGQWFSTKLSSINVFVFILDFIIEAPFKTFVEIFEEWIYYIKEEREKIY